jgi:NAD-dependent SIR2 family protein deacetylase
LHISSDITSPWFPKGAVRAAELIAEADAIVIAAGTGLGVDSGLPDFRGHEDFWRAYPAPDRANLEFTDVASPKTLLGDPTLAWGFFGHFLSLYRRTKPHEGFGILRKWADRAYLGSRIFTSNVDGQFQKAGFAANQMHECHGSIHHLQCMKPCWSGVWRADDFSPKLADENCRLLNDPPRCPVCGGLARPNILLFRDSAWLSERREHQRSREARWFERLVAIEANAVVIEIGAGTARPHVRHFSESVSWEYGARLIRIDPRECQVPSSNDVGIAAGALEALVAIDSLLAK